MATTLKQAEYELVLMLDPEAPDADRDRIAAQARERIESGGSLKHDSAWGMRKLAYEIRQRTEADYRFFRFEGEAPLLEGLDHSLKIADGVLRFRIFKVDPGSPVIVPPPPAPTPAPGARRRGPDGETQPAPSQASPPAEAPPEAAAPEEQPADAAPEEQPADAAPEEQPADAEGGDSESAEPAGS